MRTVYAVSENQMEEWKAICKAFARQQGAKLLFCNETSMGIELPDGTMKHIYIEELAEYLNRRI